MEKAGKIAKIWLDPIAVSKNYGFTNKEMKYILTIVKEHQKEFLKNFCRDGMSILKTKNKIIQQMEKDGIPLAEEVWFDKNYMYVKLTDGRIIGVPLERFPKLKKATKKTEGKLQTYWTWIRYSLGRIR